MAVVYGLADRPTLRQLEGSAGRQIMRDISEALETATEVADRILGFERIHTEIQNYLDDVEASLREYEEERDTAFERAQVVCCNNCAESRRPFVSDDDYWRVGRFDPDSGVFQEYLTVNSQPGWYNRGRGVGFCFLIRAFDPIALSHEAIPASEASRDDLAILEVADSSDPSWDQIDAPSMALVERAAMVEAVRFARYRSPMRQIERGQRARRESIVTLDFLKATAPDGMSEERRTNADAAQAAVEEVWDSWDAAQSTATG